MNAIRIRTQIGGNNELILRNLPLLAGKKVEVIILEDDTIVEPSVRNRFPLRGKVISFENPFDSASNDTDWDAVK